MNVDVIVCECFARDGLQHEVDFLPTATKVNLIERFARIGFPRIEATSYSNPLVVPQFADATQVLTALERRAGVTYKATCANMNAVNRALADLERGVGPTEISILVSASESHSQRNLKRSRAEQWDNIEAMARAVQGRFQLTGTISVAFGCPFEGRVDVGSVLEDVRRFAACGVNLVMLGDTIGVGTPQTVKAMFASVLAEHRQLQPIAHFHDTRGTGMLNYVAALEAGCTYFDCSFGGVGGHPVKVKYGDGFTGNVATEDWIGLLESMGVRTGIDLDGLMQTSQYCEEVLGRSLHSRVLGSGLNPLIKT